MSLLSRLFPQKPKPGSIARERLQLVLMHDRAKCSPDLIQMIKNDILEVLARYVDIDDMELDMQVSNEPCEEGSEPISVLSVDIPIKNAKRRK